MIRTDEHLLEGMPELAGVSHRRVRLSSMSMHVAEAGAGEPLLLIHGWPQHWWSWRLVIPELAQRHRVIALDLRGLGWSDAPPGDYEKSTLAEDVVELLDSEGIEQACVIGHDWGGYVAMLLALAHPRRVRRLLALDIPPPWAGKPHPRQLALPALASYQALLALPGVGPGLLMRRPGLVRAIIKLATGSGLRWSEAELDEYAQRLREPARAQASSMYYRTFLTRELPRAVRRGDRSAELSVPTLLLMGQSSAIDRVLAPQPSGQLHVQRIPGAGHFLPEEAPHEVLAAARDWFER